VKPTKPRPMDLGFYYDFLPIAEKGANGDINGMLCRTAVARKYILATLMNY